MQHRLALPLLAAAAAVVGAAAIVAAAAGCNSVDYSGSDFPADPFALPPSSDAALCLSMCDAEPQCVMSVFIPPLCEADIVPPTCYLKAALPPASSRACRCSTPPSRASPSPPRVDAPRFTLSSASTGFSATLGSFGLTGVGRAVGPDGLPLSYAVELDSWAVALGGGYGVVNSSSLSPTSVTQPDSGSVAYAYTVASNLTTGASLDITVLYEVREGWAFVRKSLTLSPGPGTPLTAPLIVGSVSPWDTLRLVPSGGVNAGAVPVGVVYPTGDMGGYGLFLRWSDGSGLLAAATNPFLFPLAQPVPSVHDPAQTGALVHVGYHPGMAWAWTSPLDPTGTAVTPLTLDAGVLSVYSMPDLPGPIPPFSTPMRGGTPPPRRNNATSLPLQAVTHVHTYGHGMTHAFAPLGGRAGQPLSATWLDASERDAFRAVAAANTVSPPTVANKMHIPWTENDYQVDTSDPAQWPQYDRVLQRVGQLGVGNILVAVSDYSISNRANNTDSWGWEQCLFLSNGQHIREGYYFPSGPSSLPPTTAMLVTAAEEYGVSACPYIYPILGFRNASHEGSWLYPTGGGRFQTRLDDRAFQDWLVLLLSTFASTAGSRGAGFDYTFFEDTNSTTYAQWAGWRRVLTLSRQSLTSDGTSLPWTVDNRQANHAWSPWMWAAGSYAEPLQSDEGPYSWPAYVQDPHTDRQSGNRQRQMAYDYAQGKLCPQLTLPGFIGHQSDRFTSDGAMPVENTTLNIRDFDYVGITYNLLSSIATAPVNHVVCGLPARDAGEFAAFPARVDDARSASLEFYTRFFAWTDSHREVLLTTTPLPVPPGPGVVDGTYSFLNGTGFLFLFNPNSAAMVTGDGVLAADARLGVQCSAEDGDVLVLSELWPVPVAAYTTVPCAQRFDVVVEGRGAVVFNLTVTRAAAALTAGAAQRPLALHGSALRDGTVVTTAVDRDGRTLHVSITGVADLPRGQGGAGLPPCTSAPLYLQVPSSTPLGRVRVGSAVATVEVLDGHDTPSSPARLEGSCTARATTLPAPLLGTVTYALRFPLSSAAFPHSGAIIPYAASFAGGAATGTVDVPQAVFDQLSARNASYPVPWDAADLSVPWLAPGRLLAVVDSGGSLPPGANITATLNGAALPVHPVWSCRSLLRADCFSGYWMDLSSAGVTAGTAYALVVNVPPLPVGVFQGVYYDNVDAIYGSA